MTTNISHLRLLIVLLLLLLFTQPAGMVQAQSPVVKAVLFYSPTCPHCHAVMNEVLPPLFEKYGEQLQIVNVDVTTTHGQALYQAAINYYAIPSDRTGVPTLVCNNMVLVGSSEIPLLFPSLIEQGLAEGGYDWPAIPGLEKVLSLEGNKSPTAGTWQERFNTDPVGNSLSVVVLLGMVFSLARGLLAAWDGQFKKRLVEPPVWLVPVFTSLGLIVASYLAFVETTGTTATCGPLGDCNAVQQSPYAFLFGFLPVGILGIFGYGLIAGVWIVQQYGPPEWAPAGRLGVWALATFGILFSVYLTFLEPFVIGATCIWCLSSALIMTVIFWVTTPGGLYTLHMLRKPTRRNRTPQKRTT
jgi:uncharacterized membrane protein/thiol-disulfide isomerase/thioredoxin